MKLTNAEQKAVLEDELKTVEESIYRLTIRARVADKIGNTKNAETIQSGLESLEKSKDAYEDELKALEE